MISAAMIEEYAVPRRRRAVTIHAYLGVLATTYDGYSSVILGVQCTLERSVYSPAQTVTLAPCMVPSAKVLN